MPLTQGCILIGIQAAHENVTLLVLLVFFFFSHIRRGLSYHSRASFTSLM